jgi:hypothetical protein
VRIALRLRLWWLARTMGLRRKPAVAVTYEESEVRRLAAREVDAVTRATPPIEQRFRGRVPLEKP